MRFFLLYLIIFVSSLTPAFALEAIELGDPDAPTRGIFSYIPDFVKTPEGGVSWDLFTKTKEIPYEEKDADGFINSGFKPGFSADLKKLNGQSIVMQGYMFPLDENEKQSYFLFGPFPINCPFHYHVGPALVIEVHTGAKPIRFTFDPITIRGDLELVPIDRETNTFYRLKNTEFVSSP
jgi:hypothetical protein